MSTAAESLIETVRQTFRVHSLLSPNETVLAAVSGGPDSICLLDVLLQLGFSVEVAHLDHRTRRGASSEDARFVGNLCAERGLRFHLESRAVAQEARALGLTFEEHARNARYGFLLRTARLRGCAAVATGHHADDQVETLLMRIVRGTTPRGLVGIPASRVEGGVRIVRPLLDCTRAQVTDYLSSRGLAYRIDASNSDESFLRNRVRARLLPLLEADYNRRVREALLRLREAQRTENEFLDGQARELLTRCLRSSGEIDREAFASAHRAVQRRAILALSWDHGIDECPFERVDGAVDFVVSGATGRSFDLGAGVLLRNARAVTEIRTSRVGGDVDISVALEVPGESRAFARRFVIRRSDTVPADVRGYCTANRQVFDASAMAGNLEVRRRRPGDRFMPLGMKGTRKLQDYFTDLGLSARQRDEQLLLTSGDTILWVIGRAVDGRFAVTESTKHVLEVEVRDAPE